MTRDKEIDNAKNAFYKRILEDGYYYDPRDCFEEGAEWADANPKSSWISVKEKLPPEGEYGLSIRVLVLNTDKKIGFGRYDYDNKIWLGSELNMEFTHWMLIPEPPK